MLRRVVQPVVFHTTKSSNVACWCRKLRAAVSWSPVLRSDACVATALLLPPALEQPMAVQNGMDCTDRRIWCLEFKL